VCRHHHVDVCQRIGVRLRIGNHLGSRRRNPGDAGGLLRGQVFAQVRAAKPATKPDPYDGARPKANEPVNNLVVRVRTIADMISTGMIESKVYNVDDIIAEIAAARVTERGSRADDKASEAAMEDRKKQGYF
jgi:3'-phosphoadenosine 5'-phosphosulfate sulfotransferase (PAPS reductase)/FAD synthetase